MTALNPTNEPDVLTSETATPGADKKHPQPGIGLCLSGGGYRAMLFHLGALWRLNELGLLPRIDRISSVSGGSITSAYLGMRWNDLTFANGVSSNFADVVVGGVRELAAKTIDVNSIAIGLFNPFSSIHTKIQQAYADHLFGDKPLQALPDKPGPFFIINATNVQTGALWRFSKTFMGDYHVGLVHDPNTPLALAVTASSAFPPFLSPVPLKVDAQAYTPDPYADLQHTPYTTDVVLSDGGVYDNLGLETVFKRYDTVLVSDGGMKMTPQETPYSDWARHAYRIIDITDNQVRSLRKRILLAAYQDKSGDPTVSRMGAYWGIGTDISDYKVADALNADCPHTQTQTLAGVPTRLEAMPDDLQERLINWGYAVSDAAIRRYFPPHPAAGQPIPPPKFPYARGVS